MSERLSAEISVNIGEIPNDPGFKFSARLSLGPTNSGVVKNTFRERSGHDLEDAQLYLVVPAKNSEAAEDLRRLIQATIEKATSEEGIEGLPRHIRGLLAKSDDEEMDENPKFTLSVAVHDVNVVLNVKPIAAAREMILAQFEMAAGIAGEVLSKDQEVYVEFDTARSIGDLLHSNNKILHLLEAVSLKLWIHLYPQIASDLNNIATNMGAPEQVSMILGSAGLYNSANFSLNFRTGNDLPDDVKESLGRLSDKRFNTSDLHPERIPANVKGFFRHFAENGTGNLHIFGGIQTNVLHAELHIPGLSKFLSE